ncbi:hypothetical protein RUMOBE_03710 [Blautia obeum ATCC 29174]|uniref:Uncharacterized protein n=1 Tax=Blautia obeum ATCC 29174 TaxID=411459 RepID=A5ZXF7_9FIRM|nr:hypothetical protein RUMOBE_03710 [Blautia obeum ATCC 29174]
MNCEKRVQGQIWKFCSRREKKRRRNFGNLRGHSEKLQK